MSGMKKFMHKIKEKMDIHEGQSHGHSHTGGQGQKDAWPGVDQSGTGNTGATQDVHSGQTAGGPATGHSTSAPGSVAHKATDSSRLADTPPTYQDNKMAPASDMSCGTTPKVMTGDHNSGTDALGKSPVYSPLGSSPLTGSENVASAKPKVTDVGAGMASSNITPGGQYGSKDQQPFSGSLPHIGDAPTQPKMHTSDVDPVSSKTGTGAPAPMTHTEDVDYSPNLTSSKPMSTSFYNGSGSDSKPGSHMDELKDSKANAGSTVNRSPNLTGDSETLGSPVLGSTTGMGASKTSTAPTTGMGSSKTSTAPMSGSTLTGSTGGPHMDELKDAKANAGSAGNRSSNLTDGTHELGRPAQETEGAPKPMVGEISPPYNPSSKDTMPSFKDTLPKSGNKDFGSALDKIADDKPTGTGAGTAAEAGAGTGMLAAAADYLHSGARSVADTAHQYTGADDVNTNKGTQTARDTTKPYADSAADKAQSAKDSLTPNQGTTGTKSMSGPGSTSEKRVTTPADDKSFVQQAKEGIAAAAAVTAEKASQAYQVVADKAYESGIPQKLGEHASTARDTAAAHYDNLTTQAQKHGAAAQDVAGDRLASAKAQAQDYAQAAQQRAAEHLDRFRNASPEDVNRSSLGRMVGGVALLWLASYAIGIPFKYGLAGALLAISAVLFAEWDQGNRARRHRMSTGTLGDSSKTSAEGAGSIPKYGTMGGIDAKTGAPPAAPGSIHETSIGDISSGAKQNFPQDPISSGIGGTGTGAHSSHGASSYGGSGMGSDSGAGPTVSAGGLGQSSGAKPSTTGASDSFYRSDEPSRAPMAENAALTQSTRGAATGAGFDSTYRSTEPAQKVTHLQPTAAEKSMY